MVLMLLSTIGPCSPSSLSSPLSPRSIPTSATSSFFAILSPLFDHNGPEDGELVPSPTTPASSAEFAYAPSSPAAPVGAGPFSPFVPSLKPPEPRAWRQNTRSKKGVDKLLPPLPPTPNSPHSPSKLRSARTLPLQTEKLSIPPSEIHESSRGRFSSVPSVHVSKPHHSRSETVAEVIDADGAHVVRTVATDRRSALPSPSRKLFSSRPPPSLLSRRQNSYEDGNSRANLSVAMSGVDLDVWPSPTSSGPGTPPTASFASVSSQGSGTSDSAYSVFDTPKSSFSSVSTWEGSEAYMDAEDYSMEIPIAIEVPPAAEPRIFLPRLVMDAIPPLYTDGPTSSPRSQRAINRSASTIAQRRQSVYQPMPRMRSLRESASARCI